MKRKVLIRQVKEQCKVIKKQFKYIDVNYLSWTTGIGIVFQGGDRRIKYFKFIEQVLEFVLNYGIKEDKDGKEKNKQSVL